MTRLQLRCSAEQKERWEAAAGGAGSLSSWIRDVLDRAASATSTDVPGPSLYDLKDGDVIRDRSTGEAFRVYAIESDDERRAMAVLDEAARMARGETPSERDLAQGFFEGVKHYFPDESFDSLWDPFFASIGSTAASFRDWLADRVAAQGHAGDETLGEEFSDVNRAAQHEGAIEALEEEPDGKALGETSEPGPDTTSAQVAPEGSSSNDDDPTGLDPGIPSTGQEYREADRLADTSPAFAEHALAAGEQPAEVPAPIASASLDVVVQRLFPNEELDDLMSEYEGTEHDFNDFLGWLVWRHERVEQANILPDAKAMEVRDDVSGDSSATCGLCGKTTSIAMIAKHLEDEHGIDPQEIVNAPVVDNTPDHFEGNIGANIAGGRFEPTVATHPYGFTHLDDDTNPDPEDPDDLPAPTMLEAEQPVTAVAQPLSPTCVNAAMHWRLVAGESCRYCGGAL